MSNVICPDHADSLTPAEARALALTLISRADDADGGHDLDGFVTRRDVLIELASLRQRTAEIEDRE